MCIFSDPLYMSSPFSLLFILVFALQHLIKALFLLSTQACNPSPPHSRRYSFNVTSHTPSGLSSPHHHSLCQTPLLPFISLSQPHALIPSSLHVNMLAAPPPSSPTLLYRTALRRRLRRRLLCPHVFHLHRPCCHSFIITLFFYFIYILPFPSSMPTPLPSLRHIFYLLSLHSVFSSTLSVILLSHNSFRSPSLPQLHRPSFTNSLLLHFHFIPIFLSTGHMSLNIFPFALPRHHYLPTYHSCRLSSTSSLDHSSAVPSPLPLLVTPIHFPSVPTKGILPPPPWRCYVESFPADTIFSYPLPSRCI